MKGFIVINDVFKTVRRLFMAAIVGVVCASGVAGVWARESAINDLELRSGERGIILTIFGSGPIAVGGSAEELERATARYAEMRVTISRAQSALGAQNKFSPPDILPVREITLKESGSGVELGLKMRRTMDGPIQIRSSGNQVRILLTRAPHPEVVWSSSKGLISGPPPDAVQTPPPPAAAPGVERVLGDIRIVERDNTAALYFDFTAPPSADIVRAGDTVKITFANTSLNPKLSAQAYSITGSAFPGVRISRGKGADGQNTVTAAVRLKDRSVMPVMSPDGDRYIVRIVGGVKNHVFLWSAHTGVQTSQQFTDIKPEPVDMKRMEARAAKDTMPFPGNGTFPLRDDPQTDQRNQPAPPPVSAPAPVQPRSARPEIPAAIPETPSAELSRDGAPSAPPANELVRYRIFGRDPFVPLVRDTGWSELPRAENLRLVGVLEDAIERIALLEDVSDNNRAYALRVNDPIEHGKVMRVHRDRVVFLIRDFDVSRPYTLRISQETQSGSTRGRR